MNNQPTERTKRIDAQPLITVNFFLASTRGHTLPLLLGEQNKNEHLLGRIERIGEEEREKIDDNYNLSAAFHLKRIDGDMMNRREREREKSEEDLQSHQLELTERCSLSSAREDRLTLVTVLPVSVVNAVEDVQ